MAHKSIYIVFCLGIFIGTMYCIMLITASIYNGGSVKCNGTLVVPYNGGLKNAVCIDFVHMKHKIDIIEYMCKS